jgi:hypothetical protein
MKLKTNRGSGKWVDPGCRLIPPSKRCRANGCLASLALRAAFGWLSPLRYGCHRSPKPSALYSSAAAEFWTAVGSVSATPLSGERRRCRRISEDQAGPALRPLS